MVTYRSNWKKQLYDAKKFEVKEFSIFLTGLNTNERKGFYKSLKESGVKYIPHAHIRHDVSEAEAKELIDNFGVKYFTIHLFIVKKFSAWKLAKNLCVEYNPTEYKGRQLADLKYLNKIAGFCLDISHYCLAERYHYNESFKKVNELLRKYPIAINHLNGLAKATHGRPVLDDMHFVRDMKKNFWHLKGTPRKLFSENIFLELSNSIPKQLEIREYLYKNYFQS